MADDQTRQRQDTERTEHHSALPAGARVGRYEIAVVLGQGSFGITYRARDLQLDRDVALKEYLPSSLAVRLNGLTVAPQSTQFADDFAWGRAKFLDEAKTLARLGHATAVVRVHDFLEANGTAYVVMQMLEGETLAALCRRQGLVPQAAIDRLLPPLLDGLEQIHAAGVLHRDIKPENIIVAPDGAPTLIDFGAARAAIADRAQTLTAIYTPAYAPPEQFTSRQQGPYTDIFALAATLYSCVCGRRPLSTTKRLVGDGEMPAARALGAGRYGVNLLAAVDAGLLLKAEDRPQTIGEWRKVFASGNWPKLPHVEEATSAGSRDEQATTRMGSQMGEPKRAPGALSGRGKLIGIAAAAAVLLAVGVGGALWWFGRSPPQTLGAEFEAALAKAIPKDTPERRKSVVTSFLAAATNRAVAVAPKAGRLRGTGGWPTREVAEERALEKCQQIYDEPCALIAVNDEVLSPDADGTWPIRDAPNVHYAGPFLPEHIPAMNEHDLKRGDVAGYGTARAPKAMAFNALGILTVVSGAASQHAAEEAALQACKKELPAQEASLPCYLYAVESRVVLPLRATTPITSAPPPAPPPSPPSPPPENTLRARLLESLAKVDPAQLASQREMVAMNYLVAKFHKALAALPPSGTWATADKPSGPIAEERVLEGCQVRFGAPCLMIAVDDGLQPVDASQARRSMPRAAYDGVFDPLKIPVLDDDQRERPDIAGYRAARLPKAAAFHPLGRLFTVVGSQSQRDAEEQVLAACNDDPHRAQQDGPCLLYAIGDRVVLLLGARTAVTPKSASTVDGIVRAELLQRLARVVPAMTPAAREGQIDAYLASRPHKAMVAFAPSATWRSFSQESALGAEEQALEGCQFYYKGPCVPVALNNAVLPADANVQPRSMPRVAYDGPFDPQKIPGVPEAVRRRPDVLGYRTARGPKAVAFHPWGELFIVTDAASQRLAEQRALGDCVANPQRHNQGGPCLLYAVGDQVVLPRRSTTPITAP